MSHPTGLGWPLEWVSDSGKSSHSLVSDNLVWRLSNVARVSRWFGEQQLNGSAGLVFWESLWLVEQGMGWNWLLFPFLYWFLVQFFSSFSVWLLRKLRKWWKRKSNCWARPNPDLEALMATELHLNNKINNLRKPNQQNPHKLKP